MVWWTKGGWGEDQHTMNRKRLPYNGTGTTAEEVLEPRGDFAPNKLGNRKNLRASPIRGEAKRTRDQAQTREKIHVNLGNRNPKKKKKAQANIRPKDHIWHHPNTDRPKGQRKKKTVEVD